MLFAKLTSIPFLRAFSSDRPTSLTEPAFKCGRKWICVSWPAKQKKPGKSLRGHATYPADRQQAYRLNDDLSFHRRTSSKSTKKPHRYAISDLCHTVSSPATCAERRPIAGKPQSRFSPGCVFPCNQQLDCSRTDLKYLSGVEINHCNRLGIKMSQV